MRIRQGNGMPSTLETKVRNLPQQFKKEKLTLAFRR